MSDEQQVDFSVSLVYVGPLERVAQIHAELSKWRMSAMAGDKESQFQMGRVFSAIWDELKGREEAEALIASNAFPAANAGWQEAIDRYQPFYDVFEPDSAREQVLHWFQAAAKQEHREAQYALGTFFLLKLTTSEENRASGRYWLEHAAEVGHAEAAYDLYEYLRSESGVLEPDPVVGARWLERAALLGHTEAALNLATPDFDLDLMAPTNVLRAYIWTLFFDATQPADSPHRGRPFELKDRLTQEELRAAAQQLAPLLKQWADLAPLRHG
jgi:TPR repeat protein